MNGIDKKIAIGGALLLAAGIAIGVSLTRDGGSEKAIPIYTGVGASLPVAQVPAMPPAKDPLHAPAATDPAELAAAGDHAFENGRYPEAIAYYEKAVALDPKDGDSWNDLGLARHYTGKSEEAVAALRKAVVASPSLQRAWLSLGFVLRSMGRRTQSEEALTKAAALDPKSDVGTEASRLLSTPPSSPN